MTSVDAEPEPAVFAKGGSESYLITRTTPDQILRHDISDEQLTMMQAGNRTMKQDIMWAALGAALGSLVPAISAIADLGAEASKFGYLQLVVCLVFGSSIAVFAVMAFVLRNEPNFADKIAQEIRDRTARV